MDVYLNHHPASTYTDRVLMDEAILAPGRRGFNGVKSDRLRNCWIGVYKRTGKKQAIKHILVYILCQCVYVRTHFPVCKLNKLYWVPKTKNSEI